MSSIHTNGTLNDKLVSHLGLDGDPFDPENHVFYEGAQRLHNIETLRHMSSFGDMVLVLTGEKGAGKSSLIKQFVDVADELNTIVVPSTVTDVANKSGAVAQYLAQQVGLEVVPGETVQQAFSRLSQALQEKYDKDNVRSVVVIDDADMLAKKELQFYLNGFKSLSGESGLVGVFVGLPSLIQKARLSCDYEEEEWLHQVQLKPLSVSDCLEYVMLRLESVGYEGQLDLTDVQLAHLAEVGKGLPGRLNRVFSSVLLEPGNLKVARSSRSSRIPKQIFIGLVASLVFSFVFVAFQYGVFDQAEMESNDHDVLSKSEEGSSKDAIATQFEQEQKAMRLRMLDKAISESLPDSVSKDASRESGYVGEELSLAKSRSDKREINEGNELESSKLADVEVSLQGQQASAAKAVIEKEGVVKSVSVAGSQAVLQKDAVEDEAKKLSRKSEFFRDKSWVEAKPSGSYGAQVLGSHTEQTAVNFAKKLSAKADEIYYLKTLYKGKDWYVVFYGVFESKASANKALKEAPAIVRKQKPWLRSFAAILKSYPK